MHEEWLLVNKGYDKAVIAHFQCFDFTFFCTSGLELTYSTPVADSDPKRYRD